LMPSALEQHCRLFAKFMDTHRQANLWKKDN
jgi:hypothetical protein